LAFGAQLSAAFKKVASERLVLSDAVA